MTLKQITKNFNELKYMESNEIYKNQANNKEKEEYESQYYKLYLIRLDILRKRILSKFNTSSSKLKYKT